MCCWSVSEQHGCSPIYSSQFADQSEINNWSELCRFTSVYMFLPNSNNTELHVLFQRNLFVASFGVMALPPRSLASVLHGLEEQGSPLDLLVFPWTTSSELGKQELDLACWFPFKHPARQGPICLSQGYVSNGVSFCLTWQWSYPSRHKSSPSSKRLQRPVGLSNL